MTGKGNLEMPRLREGAENDVRSEVNPLQSDFRKDTSSSPSNGLLFSFHIPDFLPTTTAHLRCAKVPITIAHLLCARGVKIRETVGKGTKLSGRYNEDT